MTRDQVSLGCDTKWTYWDGLVICNSHERHIVATIRPRLLCCHEREKSSAKSYTAIRYVLWGCPPINSLIVSGEDERIALVEALNEG
jgi:hypothetical protein